MELPAINELAAIAAQIGSFDTHQIPYIALDHLLHNGALFLNAPNSRLSKLDKAFQDICTKYTLARFLHIGSAKYLSITPASLSVGRDELERDAVQIFKSLQTISSLASDNPLSNEADTSTDSLAKLFLASLQTDYIAGLSRDNLDQLLSSCKAFVKDDIPLLLSPLDRMSRELFTRVEIKNELPYLQLAEGKVKIKKEMMPIYAEFVQIILELSLFMNLLVQQLTIKKELLSIPEDVERIRLAITGLSPTANRRLVLDEQQNRPLGSLNDSSSQLTKAQELYGNFLDLADLIDNSTGVSLSHTANISLELSQSAIIGKKLIADINSAEWSIRLDMINAIAGQVQDYTDDLIEIIILLFNKTGLIPQCQLPPEIETSFKEKREELLKAVGRDSSPKSSSLNASGLSIIAPVTSSTASGDYDLKAQSLLLIGRKYYDSLIELLSRFGISEMGLSDLELNVSGSFREEIVASMVAMKSLIIR